MVFRLFAIIFLTCTATSCVTVEETNSNQAYKYNPATATKNLQKSNAFLAQQRHQAGIKMTQSGLLYRVLKPGKGCSPMANSRVHVHYSGRLSNSKSFFDSSYQRGQPSLLPLTKVIAAWQEAIPMMKEGAIWELIVPPQLGYGVRGRPPMIPPNSALIFKVELLKALACKPQKYAPK